ncbi:hypothetical protein [Burkholderia pseudomallei]|uniref:hypothetical protein n=1 Tax=Burkholderia pseudomallei TaxID=28450 RepID=UPI001178BED9|nr:hypothetical protein [Burkholderia pseudomallei]
MQAKKVNARADVGTRTKKIGSTTVKGVGAKLIAKSSSEVVKVIAKKPASSSIVKKTTIAKSPLSASGGAALVKKPGVKVVRGPLAVVVKKPGLSSQGRVAATDWPVIVEGASRSVRLGELKTLLTHAAKFDKAAAENIKAKKASMASAKTKGTRKAGQSPKLVGLRTTARAK